MRQNKDGQVIVTEPGETLREDPRVPAENIGLPVHDWKSKAVEQFQLADRRRSIIRRLVVSRAADRGELARANSALRLAENEIIRQGNRDRGLTDWVGFDRGQ